ncbi:MAG: ATP-dependent helicase [Chloroflexota bacterium]|jgi:superfamily I DNA/RNA helicase
MSEYLKRLGKIEQDDDQRAAFYSEGSQVVIAGPGSGKTYLLTMKVAKAILEEKVRYPQKIACITYSRQLAEKLIKELRELGVYDSERMYVGTIHAFCIAEIILPAVNLLPPGSIPEPFRIASESESRKALSHALQKQGKSLSLPQKDLDKFRRRCFQPETNGFSSNALAEVSDYNRSILQDLDGSQLADDYHDYLMLKNESHSMDFVQIEMLALHILKTKPALARTLTARYPWWFVDEYQDLSPLFHQMVMHLVEQQLISVFAIGDPNQCIYEDLQGSKPESIRELSEAVERLCQNHPIILQQNYRSSQNLIDFGNLVLDSPTSYQSEQKLPGKICYIQVKGYQYQNLVSTILHKREDDQHLAVLIFSRRVIGNLLRELERLDMDLRTDKDPDYGSKTELIEWLEKVAQWCSGEEVYFYDLLPFWNGFCQLQGESDSAKWFEMEQKLFHALWSLRKGDMLLKDWLAQLCQAVLTSSRLEEYRRLRPDDVEEFEKLVAAVSTKKRLQNKTLRSFGKQKSQILLTTFHSSKGLEFDTAIVIDLDSIWKSQSAPDLHKHLAYVALSRAKSKLYVLALQQGEFAERLQNASIEQLTHWTCDSKGKITRRNEQK